MYTLFQQGEKRPVSRTGVYKPKPVLVVVPVIGLFSSGATVAALRGFLFGW